jgi:hypothetical protein
VNAPALITLQSVHEWLQGDPTRPFPTTSDNLLTRMIGAVSAFAVIYLSRPIAPATFTEVYNGTGKSRMMLRQQPIIRVRSVTVDTTAVAARTQIGSSGYVADSEMLYLDGGGLSVFGFGPAQTFSCGIQNVTVVYDAGYQTTAALAVPAATPYILDSGDLPQVWNADGGVTNASTGAAFTVVASAPSVAGTYQLTLDSLGNAQYVFAAADAGALVTITYGYTPGDIAQALIELVGERMRSRDRIGETSKNFGQTTVSFSQRDMNAAIKGYLQAYRNVVPSQ